MNLLIILASGLLWAAPDPSWEGPLIEPGMTLSKEVAFRTWLFHTVEALDLGEPTMKLLASVEAEPEIRAGLLAEIVATEDRLLEKYLDKFEGALARHGRINAFDLDMMAAVEGALEKRRELFTRGRRLNQEALKKMGLGERPVKFTAMAKAGGSRKPSTGWRRYNPESGLYESFDEKTGQWTKVAESGKP